MAAESVKHPIIAAPASFSVCFVVRCREPSIYAHYRTADGPRPFKRPDVAASATDEKKIEKIPAG